MTATRYLLLSGIAAVALCQAASAADFGRPMAQAVKVASPWEGFYIGAHGGYAWGQDDLTFNGTAVNPSVTGWFGGGQLGYNRMVGTHWLFSSEIDASFGNLAGSVAQFGTTTATINAFGSSRARLGYTMGPWLLYGTAGVAIANSRIALGAFSYQRPQVGWAGGAGVEYMFAPNWSAKLEYLYASLGQASGTNNGNSLSSALTLNTVRLGLNYRIGGLGSGGSHPAAAPAGGRHDWTGSYFGVHGGYGQGAFIDTTTSPNPTLSPAGWFAGIQSGYNWMLAPNLVVGVETDSSWGSIAQTVGPNTITINSTGTARGRAGLAMDRFLVYGTGGVAWAHDTSAASLSIYDHFQLGWVAGGGVEFALSKDWSVKGEYLYANYGTTHDKAGLNFNESLSTQTVKLGINFHRSLFDLLH